MSGRICVDDKVRLVKGESALISELMSEGEMSRPEAIGTAKILREEDSTVVGTPLLTDDDGLEKQFVSLMTQDGFVYVFREEDVEIV